MISTILLLLQAAAPADTLPKWRAEVGYQVEDHANGRTPWQLDRVAVGRRSGSTVVQGEVWSAERFDRTDQGAALEVYARPAPRLALYVRGDVAPDADVMMRTGATVALTRGLRHGWEGSVQYRRMEYADASFDAYSAGVGKYRGRWYLRGAVHLVPHDGRTGTTVGLAARRYGGRGDLDDLVELRADGGTEVVVVGSNIPPELQGTWSVSLWGQRRVGRRWGVRGTLGHTEEEVAGGRTLLGAGIFVRW